AGGDVTSGPLNINVTVCGTVARGRALTRSGARAGDFIGLSGPTGLAGRALAELKRNRIPAPACAAALRRPRPRLEFGASLAGLANACIDVSDGLLADLGHIAKASDAGARIELERLPVPGELADLADADRWDLQLAGGDDYELCFTAPPEQWGAIEESGRAAGLDVVRIGEIIEGQGCTCIDPEGKVYSPGSTGYVHGVST
ncbi:MAG: AIR synthase-related protein, partial [Xanthomonadales bacterium]|nr:AIR synthase-related protein [Xanthomonadales bacterium]